MCVIFRDESNELSSTMIDYIDATVTTSNHPLIMRSKELISYNICYSIVIVEFVL